jgi:hypothetical protein
MGESGGNELREELDALSEELARRRDEARDVPLAQMDESSAAGDTSYMEDHGLTYGMNLTQDILAEMDEVEVISVVNEMRGGRALTEDEHWVILRDLQARVEAGDLPEEGLRTYWEEMGLPEEFLDEF